MATTRTNVTFDEIPSLEGLSLQGDWFSIAPDRRTAFDFATYTDENEASFGRALYPDGLIEGFHLLGLLDHLTNAILRTDPATCTGWNYGMERARFVTPVTSEDKIRLNLKVEDVRKKDDGYVLTFDSVVDHSNSERPAFIARWLVYWLPVEDDSR
jgi:acyl dehydratase